MLMYPVLATFSQITLEEIIVWDPYLTSSNNFNYKYKLILKTIKIIKRHWALINIQMNTLSNNKISYE